jgi:DNA-binding NtrC family response regulator
MNFLIHYHYPGNVRELKNIIERIVVLSDNGKISKDSISNLIYKGNSDNLDEIFEGGYSLKDVRREVESKYIQKALKKNLFNITKTAKDLDISTRHLFNKISEYGIKDHYDKGAPSDEE